ncbi:MAG TPA: NUDIX hydrolase N-terminal domain-containing protein [Ktedonobacteraceae bacterium]|nr:NUDIX hydrolase N-terminal domain-containing protein [Ktedonobacteraceae bacterium]
MTQDNPNTTNGHSLAPAQKLAQLADILRDRSVYGLYYATDIYTREHFQKVQDVALELAALATDQPLEEIELLRSTVYARPGPFPTGDGAVIDDAGRILLIRRADNGLWAMPGGGLEVGETPAQGVVREVIEESGVSCEPVALVGVFDSRFCGTKSLNQLYQFTFLCRPLPEIAVVSPPSFAHEVLDIRWFSEAELPADVDPSHVERIPQAFRVWHGDPTAYFDKPEYPLQTKE